MQINFCMITSMPRAFMIDCLIERIVSLECVSMWKTCGSSERTWSENGGAGFSRAEDGAETHFSTGFDATVDDGKGALGAVTAADM